MTPTHSGFMLIAQIAGMIREFDPIGGQISARTGHFKAFLYPGYSSIGSAIEGDVYVAFGMFYRTFTFHSRRSLYLIFGSRLRRRIGTQW